MAEQRNPSAIEVGDGVIMGYVNLEMLEQDVRQAMFLYRRAHPDMYRIPTLLLYELFRSTCGHAAVFNKLIGDMKRVGVLGTTKAGEVFLTDEAWKIESKKCYEQTGHPNKSVCVLARGHEGTHTSGYGFEWTNKGAESAKAGA